MAQVRECIAVDLDDVLFDFIGHFFRWHNQRYGTALQPEDMVYETLWEAWGGTRAEAAERVPRFFQEVDTLSLHPMEGAVPALDELKRRFDLTIVSARDLSTADVTREWVDKFFPRVFDEVVLGVGNPIAKSRPLTKADVCVQVGAYLLIEDQLSHASVVAAAGIRVLLFGGGPWNRAGSLPPGIERVEDWAHVVRLLLDEG